MFYSTVQIDEMVSAWDSAANVKNNNAAMVREAYNDYMGGNKEAGLFIVQLWEKAEATSKEVLAICRQTLSRESKKVHKDLGVNEGQGAKVEDGSIVLAATRARKGGDSELVKLIKAFEEAANDKQKDEMLRLVQGAIDIYAANGELTIAESKGE